MAAAVRARGSGKASSRGRAPAKGARKSTSRQTKFRANAGAGLSPKVALFGAAGAIVVVMGVILLTGDRLQSLGHAAQRSAAQGMAAIGFNLGSLQVAGASPMAAQDIAQATGLAAGDPILAVDLNAVRETVAGVGWVEEVTVARRLPSTIVIEVVERAPAAVWRMDGLLRVIDAEGDVIREADPDAFPELPLVVGPGANEADDDVFAAIRQRSRLSERLEALVRIDGRRWDLRLKDGGIIQLPATEIDAALIRLDQLDQGQQVLDLGFQRIDLRSPEMIVVRRSDGAEMGGA